MAGTRIRPSRSRAAGRLRLARCIGLFLLSGPLSVGTLPALGRAQGVPPVQSTSSTKIADPYAASIAEASRRFGIPARWIRAVLHAESDGFVQAVSPKGAMGLMQLMPKTWAELRTRYHLGSDPFDVHDNILAGAAYLRELHDRYGAPGFLAAYNAGPGRYDDHLATGRPLPPETRGFVAALAPFVTGDQADPTVPPVLPDRDAWTRAPLFIARFPGGSTAPSPPSKDPASDTSAAPNAQPLSSILPQSSGLFVARSGSDAPQ